MIMTWSVGRYPASHISYMYFKLPHGVSAHKNGLHSTLAIGFDDHHIVFYYALSSVAMNSLTAGTRFTTDDQSKF